MATVKPFKALRPANADFAVQIAEAPYDVYTFSEAKEAANGRPLSFLRVDRAEIEFPDGQDPHTAEVYQKASENLRSLVNSGHMAEDGAEMFYIYRMEKGGIEQTGLVSLASLEEYQNGKIKKHELTRVNKENDRINHIEACKAQTSPVFLTFRGGRKGGGELHVNVKICLLLSETADKTAPLFDLTDKTDGTRHTVWSISNPEKINELIRLFEEIDCFYIADGHHRNAAASAVADKINSAKNGACDLSQPHNYFLSVIFPSNELNIYPYNRVVKDINGLSDGRFLDEIGKRFNMIVTGGSFIPQKRHEFGMYFEGVWYSLTPKLENLSDYGALKSLDVSILHELIIEPVLHITDVRNDPRIDFIGGGKSTEEIEKRVNSEEMKVGFSLHPVHIDELFGVVDEGSVMPPKSTWFEPKPKSGLFVYRCLYS